MRVPGRWVEVVPARDLTINAYDAVPARVMRTNGQTRKGDRPGVGFGGPLGAT